MCAAPALPKARAPSIFPISLKCAGGQTLWPKARRRPGAPCRSTPASTAAWNNLGIILQELGHYADSKRCLDRVLVLTPENPETHNNYANTCKRLGLLAEAERHWLHALELREEYAEAHSNLAHLCCDLGAYDRAAYHARRAIKLAPRFADAYLNHAMVESARDDHQAALATLERLLAFAPDHPVAMAAKSMALQKLDQPEDALIWAQQAAAAAPGNAEAAHALGQAHQSCGQPLAARQAYEKAAAIPGPVAEKASASLALLLMEMGEQQQALHAFETAIAAYPGSASLYYNRADLKRFKSNDDPDIGAMLALLRSGARGSAHDRMLLSFALGTAYLQIGDSDNAFAHLGEGNRLKRATFSYNAANTTAWMKAIAGTIDAATIGRLRTSYGPHPGREAWSPVFVLGVPRSGTTLVEQILASHSAVLGAGELQFLKQAMSGSGPYPAFVPGADATQARAMGENYRSLIKRRLGADQLAQHRYVIDKMPANFLFTGMIHAMLPDARIIHCRRDPVDTCLSCYSKLFTNEQLFTYDQVELGQFYQDYEGLMAHWRAMLPPSHFIEIQYEHVVDDLEGEARRMLQFLDLPWSPACLNFHQTARPVRTASVNQVRQSIYRSSAGRWKSHAAHLGPLLRTLRA